MSEGDEEKADERDEMLAQAYAKTRKSLIARLDNWEDQRTWDEFYQTYWRLDLLGGGEGRAARRTRRSTACRRRFSPSPSRARRSSTIPSRDPSRPG